MAEIHDLIGEKNERDYRRAIAGAYVIRVDPAEVPERPEAKAPGWVVQVIAANGDVALLHACETGGDEPVHGMVPAPEERAPAVAALKEAYEAFAGMGEEAADPTAHLVARIAELEAALKPFAEIGGHMNRTPITRVVSVGYLGVEADGLNSHARSTATVADFRAAKDVLQRPAPAASKP